MLIYIQKQANSNLEHCTLKRHTEELGNNLLFVILNLVLLPALKLIDSLAIAAPAQ